MKNFKSIIAIATTTIIAGISVPSCADDAEEEQQYGQATFDPSGHSDRLYYELSDKSLNVYKCSKKSPTDVDEFSYSISDSSNKTFEKQFSQFQSSQSETNAGSGILGNLLISTTNSLKIQNRKIHFRNFKYEFGTDVIKGLPVYSITIHDVNIPPVRQTIKLYKSMSLVNSIAFNTWSACPRLGYFPEGVFVLLGADSKDKLEKWVVANSDVLSETKIVSTTNGDAKVLNEYMLSARIGEELKVVEVLRKQDWVIDATMEPFPYGPPFTVVNLKGHPLSSKTEPKQDLRSTVENFFHETFPNIPAENLEVDPDDKSKSGFKVMIEGNALTMLPKEKAFSGYWLKAHVDIQVYANGRQQDNYIDTVIVSVADGYLPKWPKTAQQRPDDPHITQFHLKEDGSSKFENFYILEKLQRKIETGIEKKWNGEIIDP